MGFTPEPTTIKLSFTGTNLDGLTIVMRSVTVDEYEKMLADTVTTGEAMIKANAWLRDLFLDRLVEWDLEIPAGSPVPISTEGVKSLESNLFTQVIQAWQRGMVAVPTKPSLPSSNGKLPDRSVESDLGLGSLSQSPGN